MFLSEYDVEEIESLFSRPNSLDLEADQMPNARKGAAVLAQFRDWTNANSDGWVYWRKPQAAAKRLSELMIAARDRIYEGEHEIDVPTADLTRAITPIKAMLTRQGVDWREALPLLAD